MLSGSVPVLTRLVAAQRERPHSCLNEPGSVRLPLRSTPALCSTSRVTIHADATVLPFATVIAPAFRRAGSRSRVTNLALDQRLVDGVELLGEDFLLRHEASPPLVMLHGILRMECGHIQQSP